MKKSIKASKEALAYAESHTRFAIWDCSDSMRQMAVDEGRFDVLTGDKVKVKDYIVHFHRKEYVAMLQDFIDNDGLAASDLESTPSGMIIPYAEIKDELKFP